MISDHILVYTSIYILSKVYTCIYKFMVYHGISRCDGIRRYMTVYDAPEKYIQVYTILNGVYGCLLKVYQGIFQYIHVCNLTNWYSSCCTRLTRLKAANLPLPLVQQKTHSSSSTIGTTFCIFCLFRPAPPASLEVFDLAVASVGGSAARPALRMILRPAAIHVVTPTIFT